MKKELTQLKNFFFETPCTNFLIVANVIIFIVQIFYLNHSGIIENYVTKYQETLVFPNTIFASIAAWFLHANPAHLLGNMLVLFIFGRIIEREYQKKTLLIYFGSGIVSAILVLIMNEPGIGASGCIAGLISTALLLEPFYLTYIVIIPLPVIIFGWISIWSDITGILSNTVDNIGHFAHLGGYIAVMLFIFVSQFQKRKKLIKGIIINVIFLAITIGTYLYFRGKIV